MAGKKIYMKCCCCAGFAGHWQQHWNQDDGYTLCESCVKRLEPQLGEEREAFERTYGKRGVNYAKTPKPLLYASEMLVRVTAEKAVLEQHTLCTVSRTSLGEGERKRHRVGRINHHGKLIAFNGVLLLLAEEFTVLEDAHAAMLNARLFIGHFPGGLVYCDMSREKHADFLRVAFLPHDSTELRVDEPKSPLLPLIEASVARELEARKEGISRQ